MTLFVRLQHRTASEAQQHCSFSFTVLKVGVGHIIKKKVPWYANFLSLRRHTITQRTTLTLHATHQVTQVVKVKANMAGSGTAEPVLPKKAATSVVWNYFGYKRADTEQTTRNKKPVTSKGVKYLELISPSQASAPESVPGLSESSAANQNKVSWFSMVSCAPYDRKS